MPAFDVPIFIRRLLDVIRPRIPVSCPPDSRPLPPAPPKMPCNPTDGAPNYGTREDTQWDEPKSVDGREVLLVWRGWGGGG